MMSKCIFILRLLIVVFLGATLSGNALNAQSPKHSIEIWSGRKLVFKQKNEVLTKRDMIKVLEKNPETYTLMSSAKAHYDLAMYCRLAGTVMVLVPIASHLREANPAWGLLAGGFGLWALSIPLFTKYESRALAAVQLHNKLLKDGRKTSSLSLSPGVQTVQGALSPPLSAPALVLRMHF